jgi:hypothetical protein
MLVLRFARLATLVLRCICLVEWAVGIKPVVNFRNISGCYACNDAAFCIFWNMCGIKRSDAVIVVSIGSLLVIPGHVFGPGQQKTRHRNLWPRPDCQARNLSPSLPKWAKSCRAFTKSHISPAQARPILPFGAESKPRLSPLGQNKRSGRAIFGPVQARSGRAAHAQVYSQ